MKDPYRLPFIYTMSLAIYFSRTVSQLLSTCLYKQKRGVLHTLRFFHHILPSHDHYTLYNVTD